MHEILPMDQLPEPTATPAAAPPPAAVEAPIPVTATPVTQRDRQRAALRDLLALATESAAMEAEIESQYKTSVEKGSKDFEQLKWQIDQKSKATDDAARQKHAERLAKIEEAFAREVAVLKKQEAAVREQVQGNFEPVERDIKSKYDQAVWLADSVLEATQQSVAVETKKAKDSHAGQLAVLNDLSSKAFDLMTLYKQRPGAVEAVAGEPLAAGVDVIEEFERRRDVAATEVDNLANLTAPRMLVGIAPYALGLVVLVLAGVGTQFAMHTMQPQWVPLGIAIGSTLVALIVIGILLRKMARTQSKRVYDQYRAADASARVAADAQLKLATDGLNKRLAQSTSQRKTEVSAAKAKFGPMHTKAKEKRDAAIAAGQVEIKKKRAAVEASRDKAIKDAAAALEKQVAETGQKKERDHQTVAVRNQSFVSDTQRKYDQGSSSLRSRLQDGIASIQAPIQDRTGHTIDTARPFSDPFWKSFKPSKTFAEMIRFGQLRVDLKKIADSVPRQGELKLQLPPPFEMPASLGFPQQASLLIQSDRALREQSIHALQMVMTRLLTSLPAGRVRFIMLDPVGLGQNFAGFMRLADHDDALVGGRIWTEQEQIETRLSDLTEHMETVIQKYLRNEFETIDEYNEQAGELSEPYRFLVIADFPTGFEGDSFRRLASIAQSGARCGVYTLISRDTRTPLPSGVHMEDLTAHSVNIVQEGDRFIWKDPIFQQFPLTLDEPPTEELLNTLLDVVGRGAKDSKRVEVPFESIAPKYEEFWTRSSASEMRVPVGRSGATRLQDVKIGKGVAQHTLIAGKTGSGKSTLLHALVSNLAMWYSPKEIEFYLIDFKKGVEFKTYADHNLPHARAIAVESDREFGLSVLQRLDAELSRRGDLYRKVGAQDLAGYRNAAPNDLMPRTLLIIDEFQEFFSEDDKLAQEANLLMDRLVRQGRAFGVHLLLGSQTIGGSGGLARSTLGQMAVRIALMTSETDSQLILGDGNSAARLLTRPGEAIYNDQGGLVEANSPFQVAWLSDAKRDQFLDMVNSKLDGQPPPFGNPVVFEGNAPADLMKNVRMQELINAPNWVPLVGAPVAWLGDPVAIKDPSSIAFRRQSGTNILIIGQSEDSAMALIASSLVSLAAQHPPGTAKIYVLDGSPSDSPLATVLPGLTAILPHGITMVEFRAVPEFINDLSKELEKRQTGDDPGTQEIYVLIYGLQRYRILRKGEDDFSFSMSSSDEEKKPQPGKQFADLLREGPPLGIHTIAWTDTPASIDRTLDRNSVREFDNRILFQMSAADSSNLIDSPAANKLGFFRALAFSEEQGVMEKFRPYAQPTKQFLEHVAAALKAKR